ncbi:type IV pilin [Saliphagus sp. GCM10025317]
MDLKKYRSKLIGNESERAVSPVIGVILMVAITVILAAVIAAFVLDIGSSTGNAPVNAVVSEEVDYDDTEITMTLDDSGNADSFIVRSDKDVFDTTTGDEQRSDDVEFDGTGDTINLNSFGLVEVPKEGATEVEFTVVAVSEDGDESTVGSFTADMDI